MRLKFKAAAVATIVLSNGSPGKFFGSSLVPAAIAGVNSSNRKSADSPAAKKSASVPSNSMRPSRCRIAVSSKLTLQSPIVSCVSRRRRIRWGNTSGNVTPLIQTAVSKRYFNQGLSTRSTGLARATRVSSGPNVYLRPEKSVVALPE